MKEIWNNEWLWDRFEERGQEALVYALDFFKEIKAALKRGDMIRMTYKPIIELFGKEEELKPCRRCGADPKMWRYIGSGREFSIECELCGAYSEGDTPEKAIEDWNNGRVME